MNGSESRCIKSRQIIVRIGGWMDGWTSTQISGSTRLLLKHRLHDRGLAGLKPVWKAGRLRI